MHDCRETAWFVLTACAIHLISIIPPAAGWDIYHEAVMANHSPSTWTKSKNIRLRKNQWRCVDRFRGAPGGVFIHYCTILRWPSAKSGHFVYTDIQQHTCHSQSGQRSCFDNEHKSQPCSKAKGCPRGGWHSWDGDHDGECLHLWDCFWRCINMNRAWWLDARET